MQASDNDASIVIDPVEKTVGEFLDGCRAHILHDGRVDHGVFGELVDDGQHMLQEPVAETSPFPFISGPRACDIAFRKAG